MTCFAEATPSLCQSLELSCYASWSRQAIAGASVACCLSSTSRVRKLPASVSRLHFAEMTSSSYYSIQQLFRPIYVFPYQRVFLPLRCLQRFHFSKHLHPQAQGNHSQLFTLPEESSYCALNHPACFSAVVQVCSSSSSYRLE